MLIAHVGNYKPDSPNGVDKTIVGLVRHLPAQGIDVEVWHPTRRHRTVARRTQDGVCIYDLPVRRTFKGICRFENEAELFVRERTGSIELIHFHSVFQRENLTLARLGIPYVVTPNGGYDPLILSGRNRVAKAIWMKLWERRFLKEARLIQAVSLPELKSIERLNLGVAVRYIPNGLDDDVFHRAGPPPSRRPAFVFLGRLATEQKGLDLLLQGYAQALARLPNLPPLHLAGPDFRGSRERLKAMAVDLGAADRISILEPVHGESKWDFLANARFFVHTSRWEGMPFALLEALAMGRPAFVTPGTNLADEIARAGAGMVVAPAADAIATGLLDAATMPEGPLDEMGRMARSLAQAKFTWPVIASELGQAYRIAIER
jgi:glycosyltransferase involved in cell wall biosynthesis